MSLKEKILNPFEPVTFFEVVPPPAVRAAGVEDTLAEVGKVRHLADAVNLPEIHDEGRKSTRTSQFIPRVDPRRLGARIRRELGIEAVVNHCVVYDAAPDSWFRETQEVWGIDNIVLVGGESSQIRYPGPGVVDAAAQARSSSPSTCLGGITIPSRLREAERIRQKHEAGLDFFTTQVLFDSNDIVWLIQRLNGLEARVFLSFAPVSHPRDLEFLRWLGADVPADLDRFLLQGAPGEDGGRGYFDRSLDLAQRILMDVFDNLPPDPPALGLNVEHINRRNFAPAVKMLKRLGDLYANLVAARARA